MRYLLRRLLLVPVPLIFVIAFVFVVLRLTGDPVAIYLGLDATPEQEAVLRAELHLDKPVIVQFGYFLLDLVQGDFGDPLNGGTSYQLCVYDQTGGSPTLKMGATVAPGAPWRALGSSGWDYKNKTGNADGITKLSLKGGAAGKSKLQAKGVGTSRKKS